MKLCVPNHHASEYIRWPVYLLLFWAVVNYLLMDHDLTLLNHHERDDNTMFGTEVEHVLYNSNRVSVIKIPHIDYPDYSKFFSSKDDTDADENTLTVPEPSSVKVSGLGGWESKFMVRLEDEEDDNLYMFKPSHPTLTIPGGWMFRIEKGGFVYQDDRELPFQVVNELTAYLVDQLLGLERIPPVVPFEIEKSQIQRALEDARRPRDKFVRSKMNLKTESMKMWLSDDTGATTNNEGTIVGTLQYMLLDVEKPMKRKMHRKKCQQDQFYGREFNTRELFDYLIANVDRGNNNFLHPAQGAAEEIPDALVFIDQNFLWDHPELEEGREPLDTVFGDFFQPPNREMCRFYYEPVERLRSLEADIDEVLLLQLREYDLVSRWMANGVFAEDDLIVLRDMERRRTVVLDFVDRCIDEFGLDHVFSR